jgi:hypothetical protein
MCKAPLGTQEVYKRKHLVRMRKKNKEIMITDRQRRNKSSCPKIQGTKEKKNMT